MQNGLFSWANIKALWSRGDQAINPSAQVVLNEATYLPLVDMMRYRYESKQLSLVNKASVHSRQPSGHKTKLRGRGIDFDEVRRYQPGDDIRSMNWRVLAKTGHPHTKLFRDERERPVLIFADYSPSMFFATQGVYKSVIVSQIAAILAWLTFHHGDRLGGLAFSQTGHREFKPRRQQNTILKFIAMLDDMQKNASREVIPGSSLLSPNLSILRRISHSGSLIVVLSDFRQHDEKTAIHFERLARHNDIILIHVVDPLEQVLPPAGYFRVSDGTRQHILNTHSERKRHAYARRYQEQVQALKSLCWRSGMSFLQVSTEDNVMSTLQGSQACSRFFNVK